MSSLVNGSNEGTLRIRWGKTGRAPRGEPDLEESANSGQPVPLAPPVVCRSSSLDAWCS